MHRIASQGGLIVVLIAGLGCGGGTGADTAPGDAAADASVAPDAAPEMPGEAAVDVTAEATADEGTQETGGGCLPPARVWDDFALPDDPKEGIEPGPPLVEVCMEPMPEAFFETICPSWRAEYPDPTGADAEEIHVYHDAAKGRLVFDFLMPDGFDVRSDGVGVNWYGNAADGTVVRLEFSTTRARFLDFDRATGKLRGESVLVPQTGAECPSDR